MIKSEQIKKALKFIQKKIGMMFLCKEVFFGDYADNIIAAKKFFAKRNIGVLYYHSIALKVPVLPPAKNSKGTEPKFIEAMINAQIKTITDNFKNEQEAVLFYFEKNPVTKALGLRPGPVHYQLFENVFKGVKTRTAFRKLAAK